jgi:ATP-binding cassette subfamily F protein uup
VPARGGSVPARLGAAALTQKEQRELAALPAKIEGLEREQAELAARLADPVFYRSDAGGFAKTRARLDAIEQEHAAAFARWEALESRK